MPIEAPEPCSMDLDCGFVVESPVEIVSFIFYAKRKL
jgi:hypothetical protein